MLVSSVGLGQNLGLPVVAKGVETQAEWDLVGSLGVDVVQGILSSNQSSSRSGNNVPWPRSTPSIKRFITPSRQSTEES